MANSVKLLVFNGLGNEDPDQFWFIAKAVWEAQGIIDDQMKKATLVTSLEECALTWYIKYCTGNSMVALANIQTALNNEFSRSKSDAQSIIGFKEIMMKPDETPWEMDQRLRCKIREANMNLTNGQHREWFVASILPHLRVSLSQQNIGTQAKALEIAMRLHETPIQDVSLGVQQIHAELQNLCQEFQSLKKDRATWPEVCEEVWCLKCKSQGHDKDHCPVFANYVAGGGPIPLRPKAQAGPSTRPTLWCAICQVPGKHVTNNCHLLQKFVQTPQELFCNFYKSVGHDERNFYSYELIMERMSAYLMEDIRGAYEVEAKEDLREVGDKSFAIIVEVQDTMHENVQT